MGERRALLMGVQNDRFGPLDFVPTVISDLRKVVLSSRYGSCRPALPDDREFLTGPEATRAEMATRLREAMASACRDQATLFVYFLGHGHKEGDDFYLVAANTPSPELIDADNAILLGQRIKSLLQKYPIVDGLMLVIDACHSGAVISDPVPGLLRQGLQSRVEFFAATRPDEVASRGCFSKSLIELLKRGSPRTADAELCAYDEHDRLREIAPSDCTDLAPATHVSLNGSRDAGLWLGLNHAADLRPALVGTKIAVMVARLTRNWQKRLEPAAEVLQLLACSTSPIAITGGPGTGKSALLASFGRRSAGEDLGLDALATARLGDNLADLASALEEQLRRTPAYKAAAERFQTATAVIDQEALSRFDRLLIGPLAHLEPEDQRVLTIGVDAVDQLDTVQRRQLLEAFAGLKGATLIVTGRQVDDLPAGSRIQLPDRNPQGVDRLVRTLVEDPGARSQIASLSEGEWLRARLLSSLHHAGHLAGASAHPTQDLAPVFEKAISSATTAAPQAPVDEIVKVLAAAPVGAWMPLQVLVAALPPRGRDSRTLAVRVRDGVVALGELLARADAGSPDERVGLTHDLIADYLQSRSGVDAVTKAHSAILQALAELQDANPSKSVAVYARNRLSEHLWAVGQSEAALSALPQLPTPTDNLAQWQSWHERLLRRFDPDHPDTLTTSSYIAYWTGQAGDARGALDQYKALLPRLQGIRGPNHHDTLITRGNIAAWTGMTGDSRGALDLLTALLPDLQEVLGPGHLYTLAARSNIACWTGEGGNARSALDLFTALLPDQRRVLGSHHPDTLASRFHIARWTGEGGDARAALDLFTALLPRLRRGLGPDHLYTLATRSHIARWTGEGGDARGALDLFTALLPDQRRVLGPDHPRTLATRHELACWTGEAGDSAAARDQLAELLPIRKNVLGARHPDTLATRHELACWTGEAGDSAAARDQLAKLVTLLARVLGARHPDTLATRHNLACWTGEDGDSAAARDQLAKLLPIRKKVLGARHPDTLITQHKLACWTGGAGDSAAARDQLAELLPIRKRVLGARHPDTLATRHELACWTGEDGDSAAARDQLAKLLRIRKKVLGARHPDTLITQHELTCWTRESGDPAAARD